jgi:hypothetical protein
VQPSLQLPVGCEFNSQRFDRIPWLAAAIGPHIGW